MFIMLRLFTLHTLFLFAFLVEVIAAPDSDTITFFRAILDREIYARSPGRYDRVVINEPSGDHEYYIERQPAHLIPGAAIESIIVRKTKKYGNSREETRKALEETSRTKPNSGSKDPREFPLGFFFNVTFKIKAPEGQKFSTFTEKNRQAFFQPQIGNRSLSVSQFVLPFEPDESGTLEFTSYMQEDDPKKINQMLSPIKGKVFWE